MLASIDARIAAAEARLLEKEQLVKAAAADARFFECKAAVEGLAAEVSLVHTQCLQQLASEAKCAATEERKKGDATLIGCIAGIAFAAASAGSALPYALAGCAGGRLTGEAAAQRCGASDCVARLPESEQQLRAARGWTDVPQCGGVLGLGIETPIVRGPFGVQITKAGLLAAAGIAAGDAVVLIEGRTASSKAAFAQLLQDHAGREVQLSFVREELLYEGRVPLPSILANIDAHGELVQDIQYRRGARILTAEPRLTKLEPALVGATIDALDGVRIDSAEQFRKLLRYHRSGEIVTLALSFGTGGEPRTVSLALHEGEPLGGM
ncbi:MAG: hypothetical protein ABI895_11405 [Deltaproteobacteria bacterium]